MTIRRLRPLLLALLLALTLTVSQASADSDICQVQADRATAVEMRENFLRVVCQVDTPQDLMLTVIAASGSCVYQRYFTGFQGWLVSDDIYLPLGEYQVSLSGSSLTCQFTVRRSAPRLTGNSACSAGYPLGWLSGANTWQSVTFLDARALEGGSATAALCAGGAYQLGVVRFSVSGGRLTVTAEPAASAQAEISSASVSCALTSAEVMALGSGAFRGVSGGLGQAIDLRGASCVAVYVRMTVSFDPSGLSPMPQGVVWGQEELWQRLRQSTVGETNG